MADASSALPETGGVVAEASVSVGAQFLPWAEARLMVAIGLEQARSGDLAEGDGEQAVRRAFAEARKGQSRSRQSIEQASPDCQHTANTHTPTPTDLDKRGGGPHISWSVEAIKSEHVQDRYVARNLLGRP